MQRKVVLMTKESHVWLAATLIGAGCRVGGESDLVSYWLDSKGRNGCDRRGRASPG
jgi:hypothetical protein